MAELEDAPAEGDNPDSTISTGTELRQVEEREAIGANVVHEISHCRARALGYKQLEAK